METPALLCSAAAVSGCSGVLSSLWSPSSIFTSSSTEHQVCDMLCIPQGLAILFVFSLWSLVFLLG